MLSLKPDAHISTLHNRLYKLYHVLDEDDRWASLLEVLPYDDCNELERVARAAEQKSNTSPAKELLLRLASKGATVQMVRQWLTEMQLEKALFLLEDDVPLRIIEHPPPYVKIHKQQELLLICQAEGFPHPEYQWFKDSAENELEGQNRPTLRIPCAQLKDAGVYVCRVHIFFMNSGYDCKFSEYSTVEVVSSIHETVSSFPHAHASPQQVQPFNTLLVGNVETVNNVDDHHVVQDFQGCGRHYESSSTVKILGSEEKNKSDLKIIRQPVSPGRVNIGTTVSLKCVATSSLPVYYQWYCEGSVMPGETSNELKFEDLTADSEIGDYYFCKVFTSEVDELISCSVSIQLNCFDDSTKFFATDKLALLIANNIYESRNLADLNTPPNDAATLSGLLKSLDFKVITLMNLNLIEMKNAVHFFCGSLQKGSYGLVYYAGHGFEQFGQSYFQPVDASDTSVPDECVCVEQVLQDMLEKEPSLCVLLIDMCRKLPNQYREGVSIQPGKIYEPLMKRNVVYGYATSCFRAAYETSKASHGFFMKHLMKHITKKQSIQDILQRVKCDIENDTAVSKYQFPVVTSSLSSPRKLTDTITSGTSPFVSDDVTWEELQTYPFTNFKILRTQLGLPILLEFHPHKEEFCNATDMYLYIECKNEKTRNVLQQLDFSFRFNLNDISYKVVPVDTGSDSRICCCKVEIYDLQKIESNFTGTLMISHRYTGQEIVKLETLHFVQPPISKLKCAELWQRLHSFMSEADINELMNLMLPDRSCVQNHCNANYADEDLISFSEEITNSMTTNGSTIAIM